ncbi:MAG: hypothetical protein JWR04_2842 [Rhodoglobus sp.]|nr:hypothetical protein [Rhodoglobus sp.]
MLRSLGGIGRILAANWAPLLAWFLAGQLVRASVIIIAAPLGAQSPLAALLLMPVAALARLVSYIGMFLVVRHSLPGYRALAGPDVRFTSVRDTVGEFLRVLLVSIGPFFTLYALIGLLNEDLSAYAGLAFRYAAFGENSHVLDVGDGPIVVAVVVIAFAARMVLKFFGPRLPGWTAIPGIYLEATWVFVALTGISSVFGPVVEWIGNRQVVHWWNDAREFLVNLAAPIRFVIEGVDWITPVALQLVLLPLAWLFIASIIYLRALGNVVEDALPVPRAIGERLKAGASRIPKLLRQYGYLFTGTWDEVGRPAVFSGRLILRSGLASLGIFFVAYAVLFALTQWVNRWLYLAVGAHDMTFWLVANDVLSLVTSSVTEPLRVALLAAAFGYCLERWAVGRMPRLDGPGASAAPATPEVARNGTS